MENLHKDEAVPLPNQISDIIRANIKTGKYLPGKRLGTIRQFAHDFNVSPVTVIKALDILEEESLIERIPVKGIFVLERQKYLSACFAFPEREMSPASGRNDNWGLNYELYRGLLTGARRYRVSLQIAFFEDRPSPELLKKQSATLRNFDFVIFPGYAQLQELRDASAEERPTFYLTGRTASPHISALAVDYDREDVRTRLRDFLVSSGRKSAAVITSSAQDGVRAQAFLDDARSEGIKAPADPWILESDDPELPGKLRALLRRCEAEFIFADSPEIVPSLYEAAFDAGRIPGKDFIPTAVGSGVFFSGLLPRLSYFRIPRYEMGLRIMETADRILRGKEAMDSGCALPRAEFIRGKNMMQTGICERSAE